MQPNTDKINATNKTSATTIPTITERIFFYIMYILQQERHKSKN